MIILFSIYQSGQEVVSSPEQFISFLADHGFPCFAQQAHFGWAGVGGVNGGWREGGVAM